MADGTELPICEVAEGMQVMAMEDGVMVPKTVVKVYKHAGLFDVMTLGMNDRQLQLTGEHKVWCATLDEYVAASKLQNEEEPLGLGADGVVYPYEIDANCQEVTEVYNLSVEDVHNYFAEGMLVSNVKDLDETHTTGGNP